MAMDTEPRLEPDCRDIAPSIDLVFRDYGVPDSPGVSIAVIHEGRVVFAKSYGLANVENKIPATTDTNYRLASVTKQFTAMAVMILAERKQLSFDDRLTDFFPEFRACGKSITVCHLLHHTSGLLDYEDLIPAGRTNQLKDRDVLGLLKQQDRIFFSPGDRFRYSNSGYAVLALIVEKVSGLSFADFLNRNIFDPLDMTNTTAHEEGLTVVANRAYGYSKQRNSYIRTDQSLTSAVLGDGGIYSSVFDLAKWTTALSTERLVSSAMLQEAFAPGRLNNDRDTNYGFGWQLNTYRGLQCVSHSGTTIGFRNFIARFPEKRVTVIVLTNRSSPIPSKILDEILDVFQIAPEPPGKQSSVVRRIVGEESLDAHEATHANLGLQ